MQALYCVVPQSFYSGNFTSDIEFDYFLVFFSFFLLNLLGDTG